MEQDVLADKPGAGLIGLQCFRPGKQARFLTSGFLLKVEKVGCQISDGICWRVFPSCPTCVEGNTCLYPLQDGVLGDGCSPVATCGARESCCAVSAR